MKVIFTLILTIHGLIYLIGFAKAFGYGKIPQITKEIPQSIGILWLATALLFIAVTVLFLWQKDEWAILGIITAIASLVTDKKLALELLLQEVYS